MLLTYQGGRLHSVLSDPASFFGCLSMFRGIIGGLGRNVLHLVLVQQLAVVLGQLLQDHSDLDGTEIKDI